MKEEKENDDVRLSPERTVEVVDKAKKNPPEALDRFLDYLANRIVDDFLKERDKCQDHD